MVTQKPKSTGVPTANPVTIQQLEVVLTTTTTDIVPVTAPLAMKWEKDNKRRSTNSSKECQKSRDASDMDIFLKYQKEASSLRKASIKESQ